jgi:hypothetical protein
MPTMEIEENLILEINEAAKDANKTPVDFVNSSLREALHKTKQKTADKAKVQKFIESYQKVPQKTDEYQVWQDEQVWEDE